MFRKSINLAPLFVFLLPVTGINAEITPDQAKFFETKIRPVLVSKCYDCHSQDSGKTRGGLIVDSALGLQIGGDSGSAIVPGNLEESVLWNAINYQDYEMPPGRPLSREVIADFERWILMGAPDPRDSETIPDVRSKITADDIKQARDFWSFQSPQASTPPQVEHQEWPANNIDAFVLAKLEANGMEPADDAPPLTLLRRICFDLVGLPPTPQQIARFGRGWKKDPQRAIEREVDRLLGSDQFGERWGRHWLDVARYAESSGRELNLPFKHAWRYRDYVIDAFNDDKPYDRFLVEQLAGDLLPSQSDREWSNNLIATGFLALGSKSVVERNPRQFEMDLVDEQIDTTTRVMLGLSVACARCHDHKFEAIPQTDYYAMAGIFLSTETLYGGFRSQQNRRPSDLIALPEHDPKTRANRISPQQLAQLKQRRDELRKEYQLAQRQRREQRRTGASRNQTAMTSNQPMANVVSVARAGAQLAQVETQLRAHDANGYPITFCMGVQPAKPRDARLLVRGEVDQPAQSVPRGLIQLLEQDLNIPPRASGRLELAEWITHPDNPLTARVMVNRVWLHLFGKGLVSTPEDFGSTGQAPTHPELLDQLAVEFVASGWSVKSLIRKLTCSRAYRMDSAMNAAYFEQDPDNLLRWRATPRRLDAESMRDAILAISGQLETDRPYASPVAEAAPTTLGGQRNTFNPDERNHHRSVYLPVVRDRLPRALELFDFAEPSMIVGQRESSNTPSQALYLMNNLFVLQQSEAMADRIAKQQQGVRAQVTLAFRLAYGRPPTNAELGHAKKYATQLAKSDRTRKLSKSALANICQALMLSAEFQTLN